MGAEGLYNVQSSVDYNAEHACALIWEKAKCALVITVPWVTLS